MRHDENRYDVSSGSFQYGTDVNEQNVSKPNKTLLMTRITGECRGVEVMQGAWEENIGAVKFFVVVEGCFARKRK